MYKGCQIRALIKDYLDEDKKETVTVPIGQPVGTYSVQPTVLSSLHHQQSIKYATSNVSGATNVGASWFAVATKRNIKVGKHGSNGVVTDNSATNVTNVTNREISSRKVSVDLSTRKRKLNSIVEKIGNKNKESNIVGIPISIG